jgi:hypothetical protein
LEADFQTVMLRVIGIGLAIGVTATTALFFAFRAFAPERRKGSDTRAVIGIAGTLGVVVIACMLLLMFALVRR